MLIIMLVIDVMLGCDCVVVVVFAYIDCAHVIAMLLMLLMLMMCTLCMLLLSTVLSPQLLIFVCV